MEWWTCLTVEQKTTIIAALGAAILGALISMIAGYLALRRSFKNDRELQEAVDLKRAAERAFVAFHKLHHAQETVGNLKRHIDDQFAYAEADGMADLEPWAKVMQIIGSDYQEEVISPEETSFLIVSGNADLFNEVHLTQLRIWNIMASVNKYNELRAELSAYLEAHSEELKVDNDTRITGDFIGKPALVARMKENQLQNLLGQIMESLDSDAEDSWRILQSYTEAARTHFGKLFPNFRIEKA